MREGAGYHMVPPRVFPHLGKLEAPWGAMESMAHPWPEASARPTQRLVQHLQIFLRRVSIVHSISATNSCNGEGLRDVGVLASLTLVSIRHLSAM